MLNYDIVLVIGDLKIKIKFTPPLVGKEKNVSTAV